MKTRYRFPLGVLLLLWSSACRWDEDPGTLNRDEIAEEIADVERVRDKLEALEALQSSLPEQAAQRDASALRRRFDELLARGETDVIDARMARLAAWRQLEADIDHALRDLRP